jgi:hypothetical protein
MGEPPRLQATPSGGLRYDAPVREYRRAAHTVYALHYHFVFITKYRKPVLRGKIGTEVRDLIREICRSQDIEILAGAHSQRDVSLHGAALASALVDFSRPRIPRLQARVVAARVSGLIPVLRKHSSRDGHEVSVCGVQGLPSSLRTCVKELHRNCRPQRDQTTTPSCGTSQTTCAKSVPS